MPVYYNADTLMMLYEDMKEKILGKLGDYELVFVDDGSGDDSWKIMNEIREMEKIVIENGGVEKTRQEIGRYRDSIMELLEKLEQKEPAALLKKLVEILLLI